MTQRNCFILKGSTRFDEPVSNRALEWVQDGPRLREKDRRDGRLPLFLEILWDFFFKGVGVFYRNITACVRSLGGTGRPRTEGGNVKLWDGLPCVWIRQSRGGYKVSLSRRLWLWHVTIKETLCGYHGGVFSTGNNFVFGWTHSGNVLECRGTERNGIYVTMAQRGKTVIAREPHGKPVVVETQWFFPQGSKFCTILTLSKMILLQISSSFDWD